MNNSVNDQKIIDIWNILESPNRHEMIRVIYCGKEAVKRISKVIMDKNSNAWNSIPLYVQEYMPLNYVMIVMQDDTIAIMNFDEVKNG